MDKRVELQNNVSSKKPLQDIKWSLSCTDRILRIAREMPEPKEFVMNKKKEDTDLPYHPKLNDDDDDDDDDDDESPEKKNKDKCYLLRE